MLARTTVRRTYLSAVPSFYGVIRLEPLPLAHDDASPDRRDGARVALEDSGLQRGELELTQPGRIQHSLARHSFRPDRHALFR
jgi:hypothetical protein